jgi:hypothetical protein
VPANREIAANEANQARATAGLEALMQGTKGAVPLGGGKYSLSEGSGQPGTSFYEDPIVNQITKLPSLAEAKKFTGADPSFFGVQRSGDWQRVVQRKMASEKVGERKLTRAQKSLQGGMEHTNKMTPGYGMLGGDPSFTADPMKVARQVEMEQTKRKMLVAEAMAGIMSA